MGDLDHLIIIAEVDQGQIAHIANGMEARIEGDMIAQPVTGKVTRIAEGMTEWRWGDRVGYGLSEYLDHLVD